MTEAKNKDIKTIHEFLADNPNVDVSKAWKRFWKILSSVQDRMTARFPVERHPSCAGREYYTAPEGGWEGSLNTYTGKEVDWLVHSWLGNRQASILDMNSTVFLSQQVDVPHLVIVFGTVPDVFFYCDYTPRRDIRVNEAYLDKYYTSANEQFMELRGDSRFTWSVSHGTYMRSLLSPVCSSYTAAMEDDVIDTMESYINRWVDRWLGWVDEAEPVPESERAELQAYDYKLRELGYKLDPMNSLAEKVFGKDNLEVMLSNRMGEQQMKDTRR